MPLAAISMTAAVNIVQLFMVATVAYTRCRAPALMSSECCAVDSCEPACYAYEAEKKVSFKGTIL